MFGIQNYRPRFFSNCKDFLSNNRYLIKQIIGQKIEKIYWVWSEENNDWAKDYPVVIKLSNGICTLCANNFSDFAIGWNNIDFSSKIKTDSFYGVCAWKEYKTRQLELIKDKEIRSVEIINFLPRFIKDYPIYNKKDEKIIRLMGFLHGVGFIFDDVAMVIVNGLEDNNIVFFEQDYPVYYNRIIING